jgi:hypothetical protein
MTKLYDPARKPWELEPYYSRHVLAMTAEKLHEKSDIAAELAFRDKRRYELEGALMALVMSIRTAPFEYERGPLKTLDIAIERATALLTPDACTGCGSPDCSHLWSQQKKCCPDCSHK